MTNSFQAMDVYLSSGPYGDGLHLVDNMVVLYRGLARILSENLAVDVPVPLESENLSCRAIIRRSIDEAFAALVENHTAIAASKLKECFELYAKGGSVSHARARALVIFNDYEGDPFARSIARRFLDSMADEGIAIKFLSPSKEQAGAIVQAQNLLQEALPTTASGTFRLAPGVILISGGVSSAYINDNPYCFIVNESRFKDIALLAETLLHEALHQKMVDIRLSSNMLADKYDDLNSERRGDILVPWPLISNPRKWSAARALAAYHVYVHISVLYSQIYCLEKAVDQSGVDQSEIQNRLKTALKRARFLAWSLGKPSLAHYWGDDGVYVQAWLQEALSELVTRHNQSDAVEPIEHWQSAVKDFRLLSTH